MNPAIGHEDKHLYEFGSFRLDPAERVLARNGDRISLPPKAFDTLLLLVQNSGHVLTKDRLLQTVWPDSFVEENNLTQQISQLRRALGENGGAPAYIETVPKLGYRFVCDVRQVAGHRSGSQAPGEPDVVILKRTRTHIVVREEIEEEDEEAAHASAPNTLEVTSQKAVPSAVGLLARRKAAFAMAIVILAALGYGAFRWLHSRPTVQSLAVLPFVNVSGDAGTEYLSDGITESLIANLARVPDLRVKSRTSIFRYKGKDVDAQRIGKDLGVPVMVSGRVMAQSDRLEVSAELIDVRDNTELWGQHYSGKNADIISLQRQIARDIAVRLRPKLSTSERQQVINQGTKDPEAYELYLKGRYAWNKRTAADLGNAMNYFGAAIAKDPGYALAYAGVADTYTLLPTYSGVPPNEAIPKSNAAARKALELDPTLAHPHAILGGNEIEWEWDFAGGEAEYKKAFELDPNDATALQWHAGDIAAIGGREQEALAEITRAQQLDPLSPIITDALGIVHHLARRDDEAIAVCQKLANENPTFPQVHSCLAESYWGKRMYPQAIEEWKAQARISGDPNVAALAAVLEQGFRSGGWQHALSKATESALARRKNGYVPAYSIATFYADLGQKEEAFQWLETAYREREYDLLDLKTDFRLDSLRSDPRFGELVRKVGLPQ